MTKPRAPLTFGLGITRVAGLLGWDRSAEIVDRSERAVRYWSEGQGAPTLEQALALDTAFIGAGGDGAPILESYSAQLNVRIADYVACQAELARTIADVATETAEAIAAGIAVTQPGASATAVHHAIAEAEEASGAVTRLLGRLKGFLPASRGGK